jgi:hypothetical protein
VIYKRAATRRWNAFQLKGRRQRYNADRIFEGVLAFALPSRRKLN